MKEFTLLESLLFQNCRNLNFSTNLMHCFTKREYLLSLYRVPYLQTGFSIQLKIGLFFAYYFEHNDHQEHCYEREQTNVYGYQHAYFRTLC